MANFDTAALLTAQTILNKRYASLEQRMKPSPALQLLLGNSEFLVGDVNALRTREDRPIEAHFISRTRRTPGSTRVYNHTGTIDDSGKVTLSWVTKSDKTAISLKLADNSMFDFNFLLANKLSQCMTNVLEGYETAAIAYLMAQRSQYSASLSGGATFNTSTDAIEITTDNKAQFFQILKSALRRNNYTGRYDVIADSNMAVAAEYLQAQGSGNSANTNFQFSGLNIAESPELSDADYPDGVVIAMPEKSAGALTWIPKQNRQGHGDYNSYLGGYGSMRDPWGLGLTFAVHGYAQRADTSAANGSTQDDLMEFEVSLDMSFNKAPLSGEVSETPIFEAGLVS